MRRINPQHARPPRLQALLVLEKTDKKRPIRRPMTRMQYKDARRQISADLDLFLPLVRVDCKSKNRRSATVLHSGRARAASDTRHQPRPRGLEASRAASATLGGAGRAFGIPLDPRPE